MKIIEGGNFSYPRVGYVHVEKFGAVPKPLFVVDGAPYKATELDPKGDPNLIVQDWKWHGYPIVISEDTTFKLTNFTQAVPHTAIFELAEGVKLRFESCNLVNVTVPDGAEIFSSNNVQVVPVETGDKNRPTINTLHDCDKCASFTKVLREEITKGEWQKHHRLDLIKPLAREVRKDLTLTAQYVDEIKVENAEVLSKFTK